MPKNLNIMNEVIGDFAGHPAVYGLYLGDEPLRTAVGVYHSNK